MSLSTQPEHESFVVDARHDSIVVSHLSLAFGLNHAKDLFPALYKLGIKLFITSQMVEWTSICMCVACFK